MSDLGGEMKDRGMFDLKVRRDTQPLMVKPPKGKMKNYGSIDKVIRKKDDGEWEVYKSEPEVFLDCGDRYVPGEGNSAFCDCGRHCCKACLRLCDHCLKTKVCRLCLEIFRVKEKNAEKKILYLCAECYRKKKREKIIKTIARIVLFPCYMVVYLFTKRDEHK